MLFSQGQATPDGKLWYASTASPFDAGLVLDPLDSPMAGAFTDAASSYGDLLFLASRFTGNVTVVRPDRSKFEFLRSLGTTPDLIVGPDGALLAIDTMRGQLLRIVPDP